MKKTALILFLTLSASTLSCPTCVGTLEPDSPPFFSEELYQPSTEVDIDLETLLD